MVGVFVTFSLGKEFGIDRLRKIATEARTTFAGIPGLRSKAFTIDPEAREAVNFYVWESIEAASAFFTDALVERVTSLYGVRPEIRIVEMAELVENGAQ